MNAETKTKPSEQQVEDGLRRILKAWKAVRPLPGAGAMPQMEWAELAARAALEVAPDLMSALRAVENYRREYENPVPDYTHRANLRASMFALVSRALSTSPDILDTGR